MTKKITIYLKPKNKFNIKGRYYNAYINRNTNLDLSYLNQTKPSIELDSKTPTQPEKYRKILELETIEHQIMENQRKDIDIFISKFQNQDKEIKKIYTEKKKLLEQLQVKKRCK